LTNVTVWYGATDLRLWSHRFKSHPVAAVYQRLCHRISPTGSVNE